MHLLFVTVIALLTTCEAQQFRYCTPPQWEGNQGVVAGVYKDGKYSIVESIDKFSYDLNNTKMAVFTEGTTNRVPFKIDYIYDYPKKTLYTIEGVSCTKTLLNESFKEMCVPNGYEITWVKSRLGLPLPYEELLGIIGFKGQLNNLSYYITLNIAPRVPVLETLIGQINGNEVHQHSGFMNITMGIKTPSVFVPPPSCSNATMQLQSDDTQHRIGIMSL